MISVILDTASLDRPNLEGMDILRQILHKGTLCAPYVSVPWEAMA